MTNYSSILRDQFVAYGWPAKLVNTVFSHFKSDDMVGIAVRLALIGVLASLVRLLLYSLYNRLDDLAFPTVFVKVEDPAFDWIHTFLAQHPSVLQQMKSYRLVTSDETMSKKDELWRHSTRHKDAPPLALSKRDSTWTRDSVVAQLLPVDGQNLKVMHQGLPIWITRESKGYARNAQSTIEHLQLRTWATHPVVVQDFILAAHETHYAKDQNELSIYNALPNGAWGNPIARPTRAWKSVILPSAIKQDLLGDIQEFLSDREKEWYAARGIPHRRGYLLHGPPGSGKTTLASAIASHLRIDLYCVNPAARGMDDGKLHKLFRNATAGSLILIEDIDCVLPARRRDRRQADSDDESDTEGAQSKSPAPAGGDGKNGLPPSTVTLSGLLNAIDGISSQEDSVLLASSNHPEKLDDALKRPGRLDVHVGFHNAIPSQVVDLYKHFFPIHEYGPQGDFAVADEKRATLDCFANEAEIDEHAHALSQAVFNTGAEVSMAALQGFLLKYKKDPKKAVREAGEWAAAIKKEQDAKKERRAERRRIKEAAA